MTLNTHPIERSIPAQYGRLVSASLPCPGVTLPTFLRAAKGQPRFYWESSRDRVAFAGFGSAITLMAWGERRFRTIRERAAELFKDAVVLDEREPLAAPRLFGGFAFRDDFTPDNTWTSFNPAHFVLPHYQMVCFDDQSWLTINAHLPTDDDPHDLLPELQAALVARRDVLQAAQHEPTTAVQQRPEEISYPMPFETWAQMINTARARDDLDKVVLARVSEIRFAERLDVDAALHVLGERYPQTYRFLFEPRAYHAFYGATPELLAGVEGRHVETMGLAGSIKRGATPEEDAALAEQLLSDPKERYEHGLVVDAIRTRLAPLVDALEVPETPSIYQLSNIQHLYTPISGRLREDLGVLPVVETLHPTPALGGSPRELAMDFIREAEPVPRGWYAAPIGWVDRDLNGMFTVAIRSAVSEERRVWLYAGAGIVADSEPQKEWDETALKFRPMLEAVGGSGGKKE